MKSSAFFIFLIIVSYLPLPLKAQDTLKLKKPASIVKLSIGNPTMYLLYPRYGMKYVGVGYECFRNSKTSFNFYLDYYHIQDGSYNNPRHYNFNWELDNFGTKNILSLRALYKWYPLHKIKYAKRLYIAGGINAAMRYTHKDFDDNMGNYQDIEFYAGLGWGMGYRIEVKKKISLEIFYHKANNGTSLIPLIFMEMYNPIAIDLLDLSIGYVLSK